MLGRQKNQQVAAATTESAETDQGRSGGKGHPTPRRREAEERNRHPLGSSSRAAAARPGATKAERKAARRAQRDAAQAERAATRQALLTGDEARLPARDKGPVRRYVRDYVDARVNLGEYFMPFAIVVLLISLVKITAVQAAALLLIYGVGLAVIVDSVLLWWRIRRKVDERFGAGSSHGIGMYAVTRALQIRRTRLPRPQVGRRQFPS